MLTPLPLWVQKRSATPVATPGASVEDLGGPTPENYKSDDDSAKLRHLALPLSK